MSKIWQWVSLAILSTAVTACAAPEPADDDDDNRNEKPGNSTSTSSSGSGSGSGSGGGDGPAAASLAELAVGAWYVSGTVDTADGPMEVQIGWTLCSDRRLYGFTKLGNFSFLDKGDYDVNESANAVSATWRSKDTAIGDTWGPETGTLEYDEAADTLTFTDAMFGAPLYRLEGEVFDSDCDPAW
jgi:hypothetical protein